MVSAQCDCCQAIAPAQACCIEDEDDHHLAHWHPPDGWRHRVHDGRIYLACSPKCALKLSERFPVKPKEETKPKSSGDPHLN